MRNILKHISGRYEDKFLRALHHGFRAAFLFRVASVGLAFLLQILLARIFGPDSFGEYIFVFTWITILALFGKLGLDSASLRFLPAYMAKSEFGLAFGFIKSASIAVIFSSIFVSCMAAVVIWSLRDRLGIELVNLFWIGLIALPGLTLMQLYSAHIQAMKHVGLAQFPQGISRPLLIGLLAMLLVTVGYDYNTSSILWLEFVAAIVGLVLAWLIFRRLFTSYTTKASPVFRVNEWRKITIPLLFISAAQLGLAKVDILMLGILLDPTAAGLYSVASLIAGLVTFFIGSANHFIAPTISELFAQSKHNQLQRLVTVSALSITALTIPVVLFLVAGGETLLGLFGDEFKSQYFTLLILLVGQLMIVLWGSVGFLLTMSAYQKEAAWVIGLTTILNILLNALLIPYYGVIGAAIATTISVSLRSIILGVFVWKRLGIMPTVFSPLLLRLI